MNKKFVLLLICVIFFRIFYTVYLYNFKYDEWKNEYITIDIKEVYKVYEDKITYKVKYNGDVFLLDIKEKEIYPYGTRMKIISSNYDITKYGNPYEFNYKRYLNSNGFVGKIYCNKIISKEYIKRPFGIIYKFRDKISNTFEKYMSNENLTFFKCIIYGDDTFLSSNIKQNFRNIGLGHIICLSGTHIIILINSLENIIGKRKEYLNILGILFLLFLSFFKLSIIRTIIMYIILVIFKKKNYFERYLISLYFILCINPYYIFNISVEFSFLTILSIKIFNPLIYSFLNKKMNIHVKSISITIASQILIIPLEIYYFGNISLICIFSNLVTSYIIDFLLYFGFTSLIFFFIPFISKICIILCNFCINILNSEVNLLNYINYLNLKLPKPSILAIFLYYLLVIIYLYGKKIRIIIWNKRKLITKILNYIKLICFIYILLYYVYIIYLENTVIFFNVGQGNMAFIRYFGKNIIIDIGSTIENFAGNVMLNYLKAKNINKIDIVLITHMHSDHENGISTLIENNIKISSIAMSKPCKECEDYNNILKICRDNNISKIYVRQGEKIKIGNVNIDILCPPRNSYISDDDMLNANSNVYLISLKNKNYLFMGDSTMKTEKYILDYYSKTSDKIFLKLKNLKAYQVSHHGSSTSSLTEFLSFISSTNAIISADKKVYGHPSETTISNLEKYNFKIFDTQKNGAIKF